MCDGLRGSDPAFEFAFVCSFIPSSICYCASFVCWALLETTGEHWEEAIFPTGRPLSQPLFGGQAKLGVEITVMWNGQRQVLPSHSEGNSG